MNDTELYQLLESNNFKPTENNLKILKESDNYFITDDGRILDFENALTEAAQILSEDESLLEFATEEELEALSECYEIYSLNETANGEDGKFQSGSGKVQQNIQNQAQGKVNKEHDKYLKTANTYANKANDAWNGKKAVGNFFKRINIFNKGMREKAKEERATGLKNKQTYLNRANGAVKAYNTRQTNINANRAAQQQVQNDKSAKTRESQLKKKGGDVEGKMAAFRQKQTTGAQVSGGEIKQKKGFLGLGRTRFAESEELSDYELYQILEENEYKTTEKNLQILKEGLASGKYEIEFEDYSDYELYQLLESEGYATTPENLELLKEDARTRAVKKFNRQRYKIRKSIIKKASKYRDEKINIGQKYGAFTPADAEKLKADNKGRTDEEIGQAKDHMNGNKQIKIKGKYNRVRDLDDNPDKVNNA